MTKLFSIGEIGLFLSLLSCSSLFVASRKSAGVVPQEIMNGDSQGDGIDNSNSPITFNEDVSSCSNASYCSISKGLEFDPKIMQYTNILICIPSSEFFTVKNPNNFDVHIYSIKSDNDVQYVPVFQTKKTISPQQSLSIEVVIFPYSYNKTESRLHINSSIGNFEYLITGQGQQNPYHLHPFIGYQIPAGSLYEQPIILYNPHRDILHIREVFTTEIFLTLYGKAISNNNKAIKKNGQDVSNRHESRASEMSAFQIGPSEETEIIRLQIVADMPGTYHGYVHVKTDKDNSIIPVDFTVYEASLHTIPSSIDFGILTTVEEIKTVTLLINNTGGQTININEIVPLSYDPYIKIELPVPPIIKAGSIGVAATLHYSSIKQGKFSNTLLIFTNFSNPALAQLEVTYEGAVLHGGIGYEQISTQFILPIRNTSITQKFLDQLPQRTLTRKISFINYFPVPISLFSVTHGSCGDLIEISDENIENVVVPSLHKWPPIELKLRILEASFMVQAHLNFVCYIELWTNASSHQINLLITDGRVYLTQTDATLTTCPEDEGDLPTNKLLLPPPPKEWCDNTDTYKVTLGKVSRKKPRYISLTFLHPGFVNVSLSVSKSTHPLCICLDAMISMQAQLPSSQLEQQQPLLMPPDSDLNIKHPSIGQCICKPFDLMVKRSKIKDNNFFLGAMTVGEALPSLNIPGGHSFMMSLQLNPLLLSEKVINITLHTEYQNIDIQLEVEPDVGELTCFLSDFKSFDPYHKKINLSRLVNSQNAASAIASASSSNCYNCLYPIFDSILRCSSQFGEIIPLTSILVVTSGKLPSGSVVTQALVDSVPSKTPPLDVAILELNIFSNHLNVADSRGWTPLQDNDGYTFVTLQGEFMKLLLTFQTLPDMYFYLLNIVYDCNRLLQDNKIVIAHTCLLHLRDLWLQEFKYDYVLPAVYAVIKSPFTMITVGTNSTKIGIPLQTLPDRYEVILPPVQPELPIVFYIKYVNRLPWDMNIKVLINMTTSYTSTSTNAAAGIQPLSPPITSKTSKSDRAEDNTLMSAAVPVYINKSDHALKPTNYSCHLLSDNDCGDFWNSNNNILLIKEVVTHFYSLSTTRYLLASMTHHYRSIEDTFTISTKNKDDWKAPIDETILIGPFIISPLKGVVLGEKYTMSVFLSNDITGVDKVDIVAEWGQTKVDVFWNEDKDSETGEGMVYELQQKSSSMEKVSDSKSFLSSSSVFKNSKLETIPLLSSTSRVSPIPTPYTVTKSTVNDIFPNDKNSKTSILSTSLVNIQEKWFSVYDMNKSFSVTVRNSGTTPVYLKDIIIDGTSCKQKRRFNRAVIQMCDTLPLRISLGESVEINGIFLIDCALKTEKRILKFLTGATPTETKSTNHINNIPIVSNELEKYKHETLLTAFTVLSEKIVKDCLFSNTRLFFSINTIRNNSNSDSNSNSNSNSNQEGKNFFIECLLFLISLEFISLVSILIGLLGSLYFLLKIRKIVIKNNRITYRQNGSMLSLLSKAISNTTSIHTRKWNTSSNSSAVVLSETKSVAVMKRQSSKGKHSNRSSGISSTTSQSTSLLATTKARGATTTTTATTAGMNSKTKVVTVPSSPHFKMDIFLDDISPRKSKKSLLLKPTVTIKLPEGNIPCDSRNTSTATSNSNYPLVNVNQLLAQRASTSSSSIVQSSLVKVEEEKQKDVLIPPLTLTISPANVLPIPSSSVSTSTSTCPISESVVELVDILQQESYLSPSKQLSNLAAQPTASNDIANKPITATVNKSLSYTDNSTNLSYFSSSSSSFSSSSSSDYFDGLSNYELQFSLPSHMNIQTINLPNKPASPPENAVSTTMDTSGILRSPSKNQNITTISTPLSAASPSQQQHHEQLLSESTTKAKKITSQPTVPVSAPPSALGSIATTTSFRHRPVDASTIIGTSSKHTRTTTATGKLTVDQSVAAAPPVSGNEVTSTKRKSPLTTTSTTSINKPLKSYSLSPETSTAMPGTTKTTKRKNSFVQSPPPVIATSTSTLPSFSLLPTASKVVVTSTSTRSKSKDTPYHTGLKVSSTSMSSTSSRSTTTSTTSTVTKATAVASTKEKDFSSTLVLPPPSSSQSKSQSVTSSKNLSSHLQSPLFEDIALPPSLTHAVVDIDPEPSLSSLRDHSYALDSSEIDYLSATHQQLSGVIAPPARHSYPPLTTTSTITTNSPPSLYSAFPERPMKKTGRVTSLESVVHTLGREDLSPIGIPPGYEAIGLGVPFTESDSLFVDTNNWIGKQPYQLQDSWSTSVADRAMSNVDNRNSMLDNSTSLFSSYSIFETPIGGSGTLQEDAADTWRVGLGLSPGSTSRLPQYPSSTQPEEFRLFGDHIPDHPTDDLTDLILASVGEVRSNYSHPAYPYTVPENDMNVNVNWEQNVEDNWSLMNGPSPSPSQSISMSMQQQSSFYSMELEGGTGFFGDLSNASESLE